MWLKSKYYNRNNDMAICHIATTEEDHHLAAVVVVVVVVGTATDGDENGFISFIKRREN